MIISYTLVSLVHAPRSLGAAQIEPGEVMERDAA
jgi:hypothetical protein